MQGYGRKRMTQYNHPLPKKPQHTPLQSAPQKYGNEAQRSLPPDNSPPLNEEDLIFL